MTRIDKIIALCAVITVFVFAGVNLYLGTVDQASDKSYRVEINRVKQQLSDGKSIDLSDFDQVTAVQKYDGSESFFSPDTEYVITDKDGDLWRIDYSQNKNSGKGLFLAV